MHKWFYRINFLNQNSNATSMSWSDFWTVGELTNNIIKQVYEMIKIFVILLFKIVQKFENIDLLQWFFLIGKLQN